MEAFCSFFNCYIYYNHNVCINIFENINIRRKKREKEGREGGNILSSSKKPVNKWRRNDRIRKSPFGKIL